MEAGIEEFSAYLRAQGMPEEQVAMLAEIAEEAEQDTGMDTETAAGEYHPAPQDAADEELLCAVTAWLGQTLPEVSAKDVTALWLGCAVVYPDEESDAVLHIRLSAAGAAFPGSLQPDTGEHRMPADAVKSWCSAKALAPDDIETEDRLLDLLTAAVMRLHEQGMTEKIFGKKLPVMIADFDSANPMTAVRALKANGEALFEDVLFKYCGLE